MNSRASGRAIGGSPNLMLSSRNRHSALCPAFAFAAAAVKGMAGAAERPSHCPVLGQLQLCARRRQPGAQSPGRLSSAPGRTGPHLIRRQSPILRSSRPADRQRAVGPDPVPARISAADRADRARPARPCGIRAEHRPHLQPGHRRPPRGQLGPAAQHRRYRFDPHPLRNLPGLLSHGGARAGGACHHAAAVPALRRDRRTRPNRPPRCFGHSA